MYPKDNGRIKQKRSIFGYRIHNLANLIMYVGELKNILRNDSRLRLLLLCSLLVQTIVCLTAVGIYHPDQYFQIIEFSSYQLHRP